jgi:hypothetical protein
MRLMLLNLGEVVDDQGREVAVTLICDGAHGSMCVLRRVGMTDFES